MSCKLKKVRMNWIMGWNPQGTVREMRALYTTDHCDAESVKILTSRYNAQKTGESDLVCVRACVFMRADIEGTNRWILCSRNIICVLRFPVVSPAVVTALMKTTPRHRWVFTLARAPCALAIHRSQLFNFHDGHQRAHVLACGIGASNGWGSTRDLTLTAEKTGDRRFAPRAPLCRR